MGVGITWQPGEGPLGWESLLLLFQFITNLETLTVGWGLFQNLLRSVPKWQREVNEASCTGSQAWWPPSHILLTLCTEPPRSRQPHAPFARSCQVTGEPAAGTLALVSFQATATATH